MNQCWSFKRIYVVLIMFLIVPGLMLFPQTREAHKKPVVKKGATMGKIRGSLRSMADVKQIPLDQLSQQRKMRAVLNLQRTFPGKKDKTPTDTVVQRSVKAKTMELQKYEAKIPSPILTFDGLNLQQHGSGIPPDTTGDVGITHYVQAVNVAFGIFNKSTGALVSWSDFDNFFNGPAVAGTPCDNDNQGDPIVLYDSYADRWIIMNFAFYYPNHAGSWFSIAASTSGDPTGTWYLYALQADPVLMNDYPKMGVWHDGIYITANMFTFPNVGGQFQGVRIWALNKADLYSGTMTYQTLFDNSWEAWSILPANAKGATPPPAAAPHYMVTMDADDFGGPGQDRLVFWEFDVDWTNPANTTWTGPIYLPTAPFDLNFNVTVPQQGTANGLDAIEGRLMFPAMYRNFGSFASIYVCHTAESANTRKTRWYETRITGGTPSIYQQGTYAPDTVHRWMASTGGDEDGNIAVGWSASSSAMHPAIWYSGRASINPTLNVLQLGEASIWNGSGSQTTYDRWGDYTTMTIDPVDDQTFWYTNEYLNTNSYLWRTRIGYFRLKPDLWSQDRPDDIGLEPNTISNPMWCSNDIWVRNQPDGLTNHTHQNPEYGQTNYLYVMIRCLDGEGSGIDKVYWAYPGTGLSWPASWNLIGSQPTGTLTQGNTTILEFPWTNVPNPGAYGSGHFCLLSRIETAPFAPYGMTFPEVASINTNVRNNNNIVWKNITIVDNIPNGGSGRSIISVGNLTREEVTIRLEFRALAVVRQVAATLETEDGDRDILDWGTVQVNLGKELFARWQDDAKSIGTGITTDKELADTVTVVAEKANIDGIKLKAGEQQLIEVIFTPSKEAATDKNNYLFDVVQHNFDGKKWVEVGGVRFVVKPPVNVTDDSISETRQ